jgi:hypothetical protein
MNVTASVQLSYARIGTRDGLACQVGIVGLFFPDKHTSVWIVRPEDITITAAIPPLLLRHLRERVERRLLALREVPC